jgi:heme exporter protein D
MLAGGYSWNLFFYVVFAFAMALLILAFFVVEETAYKRHVVASPPLSSANSDKAVEATQVEVAPVIPARKSYVSTLKPWSGIDHESEFWIMIPRSFTYFLVPQVLWVITTFGTFT